MGFTCPVCESSEYDELNGLFFCTTCCTQSQEIHVQEVEEVFREGGMGGTFKKIKRLKKNHTTRKELGRPWTIYEGYQCIILAQCDALIALGAKEDLKEVVFLIWANYLSQLGVAFCKQESIVPKIVMQTGWGRLRELHRGTLEKPWNKKRETLIPERIPDEDFYDSDIDDLPIVDEDPYDRKNHAKASTSPEWMDLKKTIAFCYIGLRVTNPEILPSQYIRWIYEGKVPFISTTHLLNPDMVLFREDLFLFQPTTIRIDTLFRDFNKLVRYLNIHNLPSPSIQAMFDQLVDLLHLPGELKLICQRFHDTVSYKKSGMSLDDKKMDFTAVQYIAFALKMIFGLDNETEGRLSNYSEELQQHLGPGVNLFIWNKWRSFQMENTKRKFDAYLEFKTKLNSNHDHLDQLLECYHNFHRKGKVKTTLLSKRGHVDDTKTLDKLKKPLQMAVAALDNNNNNNNNITDEEIISIKNGPQTTHYSESTLAHIVDPKFFKSKYKNLFEKNSWSIWKRRMKQEAKSKVYKSYSPADEKTMHETRPNSYLWLLNLLSNSIGCHEVKLDIAVNKLQSLYEKKFSKDS